MRIIVQKFGGTSLATLELRTRVCEIITSAKKDDIAVVVVVSAMGREKAPYATDTLINMVKEVNPKPSPRELDLIMSCGEIISGVLLVSQLSARGFEARFFTGQQAGIITDSNHGNAHILYVNPKNILEVLSRGIIPVVAGFQGVDERGEITTLGRGGSDTTAATLGVALNAEVIDIFTDVEGVMTADPRIVENARLLDAITYNEICQLAREGAKVIHPRAVEIAMQRGIPMRVRSTFSENTGTLVTNTTSGTLDTIRLISDNLITGVTHTSNISQFRINISDVEDKKGCELKVFKALALAGISVDFINIQPEVILFTVQAENTIRAVEVLRKIGIYPDVEMNCAKVAVVGAAMTGIPGVMAKVVEALTENEIPILQSGDSYTNIWCLVKREHMEKAVKVLHDKFELGK
ncbi:aspartate kinase [Thermosyntropha sp.]|uniref:aspartate kinase n=1 Tax=Thermosyntropha sp. TaxID=2740820 RepID=UPI0025FA1753|nr:aspartate kinase [Thermosyntropha sp.]MBO8159400.1 aspartate kinase [Thermosyntropha sp.]